MIVLFARLWLFVRAEINWRRGVRLATCPRCGDINTDDLLPDNPEPAYCLTCATERAKQAPEPSAPVVKLAVAHTWELVRAPAREQAALIACQIMEAEHGAPVRVLCMPDARLVYYGKQGQVIMERDPVARTITVGGKRVTYAQIVNAHNPMGLFTDDHEKEMRNY